MRASLVLLALLTVACTSRLHATPTDLGDLAEATMDLPATDLANLASNDLAKAPPVGGTTELAEATVGSGLASLEAGIVWAFDVAWEDYDGDGRLDLFLADHDTVANHNRILHNEGDGTFANLVGTDVVATVGTWSLSVTDVDSDGAVDFIPNWDSQNSALFVNAGASHFTTVGSPFDHQANGAAYADYDGDGLVDLFVSNFNGRNRLWHRSTAGTAAGALADASATNHVATERASATALLADLDGDGAPELVYQTLTNGAIFEAKTGCQTWVAHNDGNTFAVPTAAGLSAARCFNLAVGDYDNDSDLDLVSVGSDPTGNAGAGTDSVFLGVRLFENDGTGQFTDVTATAGLPSDAPKVNVYPHIYDAATFVDLDADGRLDLLVTVGKDTIYRNLGNGTFEDVTATWKLAVGGGRPERFAVGDYDGDGDVDLVTMTGDNSGATVGYRLWQNQVDPDGWLTVRLRGSAIPTALGSRITVFDAGHAGDASHRRGYREVLATTSQRAPLEQYFGVPAGDYDVVVTFWPSQKSVTVTAAAPARVRIHEDGSHETY